MPKSLPDIIYNKDNVSYVVMNGIFNIIFIFERIM